MIAFLILVAVCLLIAGTARLALAAVRCPLNWLTRNLVVVAWTVSSAPSPARISPAWGWS